MKTPVVILAFEDVGCGRSMEVYYQALLDSPSIQPIMAYTKLSSYSQAPSWVTNKLLCEIEGVDCYPEDSLKKKKKYRLYDEWFKDIKPYISFIRKILGEKTIWVIDMVIPELEEMLGKYVVQTFHGHLFEIGSTYFQPPRDRSFKRYSLIFANGNHMYQKIALLANLSPQELKKVHLVGKLLNTYLKEKNFDRTLYLKSIGLSPARRTVCYAPTWESKKVWPVGTFKEDKKLLHQFCEWIVKNNLNLILRPHPLNIKHYEVDKTMKAVADEFPGFVYLENTLSYNPRGPKDNLLASDVLVTDLSSIALDFMSLNKPAVFFYPDQQSELWGEGFPSLSEVSAFSYTVESFPELMKKLLRLLKNHEEPEAIRERKKVVQNVFSLQGPAAQKAFRSSLEHLVKEQHFTDLLSVYYLKNYLRFLFHKEKPAEIQLQLTTGLN